MSNTKITFYPVKNGDCNLIEFSERFLNKNKYYYGMILSEHRHPSIDALHYLIKSISELSETETNSQRLDDLYEEGHNLITKRLLKNY